MLWNPESTVWNPESKTALDYILWGEARLLRYIWDIENKRRAGVKFMLIPLVFGTNGGNKCQVLGNSYEKTRKPTPW